MSMTYATEVDALVAACFTLMGEARKLVRTCPQCGRYFLKDGKRKFCRPLCMGRSIQARYVERHGPRRKPSTI